MDRNGLEVVFHTGLTGNAQPETAVATGRVVPSVKTEHATYAGIPTEITRDGAGPLVDTCEVEVKLAGVFTGTCADTEVEFKAIAAQILLVAQFTAETPTVAETYTDCLLCICCNAHGENSHEGQ